MYFFFSSRRRHTRLQGDWSSDVCSSDLVAEVRVRDEILGLIEEELQRPVPAVRRVAGEGVIAERFPQFRQRLARRLPTLNQVNRQQIELLRRYRGAAAGKAEEDTLAPLLLSINCIAAGFGATG